MEKEKSESEIAHQRAHLTLISWEAKPNQWLASIQLAAATTWDGSHLGAFEAGLWASELSYLNLFDECVHFQTQHKMKLLLIFYFVKMILILSAWVLKLIEYICCILVSTSKHLRRNWSQKIVMLRWRMIFWEMMIRKRWTFWMKTIKETPLLMVSVPLSILQMLRSKTMSRLTLISWEAKPNQWKASSQVAAATTWNGSHLGAFETGLGASDLSYLNLFDECVPLQT